MNITLNEETDFTITALMAYMKEKHGTKKSGKPFRNGDAQGWMLRGNIPASYGGYKLEYVENEAIGIKLIRVHFT